MKTYHVTKVLYGACLLFSVSAVSLAEVEGQVAQGQAVAEQAAAAGQAVAEQVAAEQAAAEQAAAEQAAAEQAAAEQAAAEQAAAEQAAAEQAAAEQAAAEQAVAEQAAAEQASAEQAAAAEQASAEQPAVAEQVSAEQAAAAEEQAAAEKTAALRAALEEAAAAKEVEGLTGKDCFESRVGLTGVQQREIEPGWPNVKCSDTTGGVLWWGDPFDGTIPMGDMPIEADYSFEEAVVKPREPQIDRNKLLTICTTACHDGKYVPVPKDKMPRDLKMHKDIVPESMKLKHGKGAIWCLDCHHPTNRTKLIDHFGNEVGFNQPQVLCGKCHGQIFRNWRDGIHGKRIGMWNKGGKKRWWVCTECHNPHDVEQGDRNSGFAQLHPELAPELPKGMPNADHEREHEGAHGETH